jgi:hypothetical protein
MPEDRRLAAIMFTDIVGYTALMGKDEKRAFQLLEKNRKLHEPLIERHNGSLLKEIGDAILASFQSVYDAVKCAEQIIQTSRNVPDLSLRIGIHEGEVIFKEGDVFGDGVNVASRIQALAVPNSVLISGRVYDEIANKRDIKATHLGTFELKGDAKFREIYAVFNEDLVVPSSQDLSLQPVEIKQIIRGHKKISPKTALISLFTVFVLVFGSMILINFRDNNKSQWARQTALLEIERLINQEDFKGAYEVALQAEKFIPKDSLLVRLWPRMSVNASIHSDPPGARVFRRPYRDTKAEWEYIGITPIDSIRLHRDISAWKMELTGFNTLEFLRPLNNYGLYDFIGPVKLIKSDSLNRLVYINGEVINPRLPVLIHMPGEKVNDFLIDQFEVTNSEYKEFVDAGGYENKEYWLRGGESNILHR